MSYQIEVERQLEPFFAEPRSWDSLAGGVPFRETAWLAPWWRHLSQGRQAHLLVARKPSGQICGLLPLYQSSLSGPRTLSMLGDGDACSDHVSVLARPDEAIRVAKAFGHFLGETASDSQNGWDLIDIDGIVEGDQAMSTFAAALKSTGSSLHTVSRMHTWFKPTDESWEEHLKRHGKTQRRRMRRMTEKIGPDGCFDRFVAETESDVDQLLSSLIDMHQHRWHSVGEPGSYADAGFRGFMFDTAKEFLKRGRLYLNLLQHAGRDIGAEINFIGENRILYCYSAGYDLESADLEPGRLVNIDTLQQLYRADLAGIDYMRGDEEYKKRLSTSSRRILRLRAVSPALLPRLRHAAWCTGFEVKQWMRKRTGRLPIETPDITTPVMPAS